MSVSTGGPGGGSPPDNLHLKTKWNWFVLKDYAKIWNYYEKFGDLHQDITRKLKFNMKNDMFNTKT